MKLESPEGFVVHYNLPCPNATPPVLSTAFPHARSATLDTDEASDYWLFHDEHGALLGLVPDRQVLCILKLETVGPTDANLP